MKSSRQHWLLSFLVSTLALPTLVPCSVGGGVYSAQAQTGQRTFPETGKSVQGKFLAYWDKNGGLPQQGFPISGEMQEVSDTDGKTYTVQYFERAVFELHPENQPPNDVLLSLLGVFLYNQKYPTGAPNQAANNQAGSRLFQETGKRVGGVFLDYWTKNGGLPQQGFPISDEFNEVSGLDGKTYKVQYFQRAVFEYHPENKAPYDVLLSQLGTFRYRARYLQPVTPAPATAQPTAAPPGPVLSPTPTPTSAPEVAAVPQPPEYAAVRARFENMTTAQWRAAGYIFTRGLCRSGVGVVVTNNTLWEAAYHSGVVDPQNPPHVLLNGRSERIIGLMWLAGGNTQPPPVLFGRQMQLNSYEGIGEPVYLFHSFFKPNGYVLFANLDHDDPCIR